jgi:hypothetical protein
MKKYRKFVSRMYIRSFHATGQRFLSKNVEGTGSLRASPRARRYLLSSICYPAVIAPGGFVNARDIRDIQHRSRWMQSRKIETGLKVARRAAAT